MRSQQFRFAAISIAVAGLLLGAGARIAFSDELVLDQSFETQRQITAEIPVRSPHERHRVEVFTSGPVALSWLVDDPDGEMLSGGREFTTHEGSRNFRFTPRDPGTYRLQLESTGSASVGSARVRVTVEHPGPVAFLLAS